MQPGLQALSALCLAQGQFTNYCVWCVCQPARHTHERLQSIVGVDAVGYCLLLWCLGLSCQAALNAMDSHRVFQVRARRVQAQQP